MKETWTKEETLYIYAYILKYPTLSDEQIAEVLLHDEWIVGCTINILSQRVEYLRKNQDSIFLPE